MNRHPARAALGALTLSLLAACGGGGDETAAEVAALPADQVPSEAQAKAELQAAVVRGGAQEFLGPWHRHNTRPAWLQDVTRSTLDGVSDDLLTAGLGRTGLSLPLPAYADPLAPTAAELRRAAIHTSYRAIVDMTAAGGYGTFYGPNVAADGTVGTGEGRIAGTEWSARLDDGSGRQNVALVVQVPASFDLRRPCIVTATSSGSRGVYGAISTGEWGLKRGCAVAYTDKGTGGAPHDLASDTVARLDGTRGAAAAIGAQAHFRAALSAEQLAAFNAATPNRLAFKHAHSQRNPEKDWGRFTLQAVEFAFWALNEQFAGTDTDGRRFRQVRPGNTLVIASSVSNGGGAAIAAAELDRAGLIDGVAVSEPAIEMPRTPPVSIRRGSRDVTVSAKPLVDFTTQANLFQSCAALAPQAGGVPGQAFVVAAFAANRCAQLKARGLLTGETTAEQAAAAQAALVAYGWEPESAVLHASLAAFEVAPAVSVTFANALARASVSDRLCGYGFAATTAQGLPTATTVGLLAPMAATGNGVPPAAGIQLINERHPGFALRDLFSASPSTGVQDFNLDGALCLRELVTGDTEAARALQAGLNETRRQGRLHGKPTVIVHGREDALLPVNHTSRPYAALNRKIEGPKSELSYVEVTNAQHFDGFIGLPTLLPGYDSRYVPLHVYLNRALDAVHARLATGTPLPPSQVLRTVPRGGTPGAAPALTAANVPPIAAQPAAGDRIEITPAGRMTVPD